GADAGLAEQPGRLEQRQQGRLASQDRLCDQLAAHEAERVAVSRVAAGDPDPLPAGKRPDHGQEVEHEPEDPCPAMSDLERGSDGNRSSASWMKVVVSSTAVNSVVTSASRKPPATRRPSSSCCQ